MRDKFDCCAVIKEIQIIYHIKAGNLFITTNYDIKMTHHKNILIPHIHHPHTFERMNREEDVRTTFENKFYIAPNR